MPVRLDSSSADFAERFASFLGAKREVSADIEAATRAIVDDVAARGDLALIEATRKFDRLDLNPGALRITTGEIDAAVKACDTGTLDALEFARTHPGTDGTALINDPLVRERLAHMAMQAPNPPGWMREAVRVLPATSPIGRGRFAQQIG